MKFFSRKFFVALLLFAALSAHAEIIVSIQDGQWESPNTWSSGTVPLPTDSVVVDHYVIFTDTIFVDSAGDLLVDSCGTLCGDQVLHGHFINYGNMYIGSFHITDTSYSYGTIISNNTASSSVSSGYLWIKAGSLSIGPNIPPCIFPRSAGACARVSGVNDATGSPVAFRLSPNPATDEITITTEAGNHAPFTASIYDITGKLLFSRKNISNKMEYIKVFFLPPGYYVLKLTDEQALSASKGFIIAR